MNRDDIIRMAQEAGAIGTRDTYLTDGMERFATIVAAAEREACAQACDARVIADLEFPHDQFYNQAAKHCAKAIRIRGKK